jgi:23S rRNA (guanine745-N1)-methyltransferase
MRFLTDKRIEGALVCPICKSAMRVASDSGASLICGGGKKHCYDFSSRGYVNFMSSGYSSSGDSKQSVAARSAFLNKEFYRPVAEAICDVLNKHLPNRQGLVVDAGCGEGYYSSMIAAQGFCVWCGYLQICR